MCTNDTKEKAQKAIAEGETPRIPKDYQGGLHVVSTDEGLVTIEQDNEEYQRQVDKKGYSAIGSSRKLTADEINQTVFGGIYW